MCLYALAGVYFAIQCSGAGVPLKAIAAPSQGSNLTAGIKDYARPEESTYLSYPEWYIVWSYQERADYQEKQLPTRFPFFGAIKQYWCGYCAVYGLTHARYPFNLGDHVMLVVIGSSFSVEYAIRGVYENTVGRLTEWLSSHEPAEEDQFAYRVAREYADFVHIRPFYEFSFWKRLKGLWSETRLWGKHPVRKWERKFFLTLDYGIEAFYCWIIEKLTHATYGIEGSDTYVWIENAPPTVLAEYPRVRVVKPAGRQSFLAIMPRYQEFTTVASQLAARDVHFVEIAGNREILLTVLAPRAWTYSLHDGDPLFSTDILTQPEWKRVAVRSPVRSLHVVLNALAKSGVRIEHVYDY